MQPTPKLKKLYETLYNDKRAREKFNLPDDYKKFEKGMVNQDLRKRFYGDLPSFYNGLPNYEEFSIALGLPLEDKGPVNQGQPQAMPQEEEDLSWWEVGYKNAKNFLVQGVKQAVGFYNSTYGSSFPMSPGAMPIAIPGQKSATAVDETLESYERFKKESPKFKNDLAQWAISVEKEYSDNKGLVQKYRDIEDVDDAVNYVIGMGVQALASGVEASATGGVSPFLRSIGSSYFDTIEKEAKKEGKTAEQVILEGENNEVLSALSVGFTSGLIERIGISSYMSPSVKNAIFGKSKNWIANAAKRAIVGAVGEGTAESSQGAIQDIGSSQFASRFEDSIMEQLSSSDFWKDRSEDFVGGATGGGLIGGGMGAIESSSNTEIAKKVKDEVKVEDTQEIAKEKDPQIREAKKKDYVESIVADDKKAVEAKKEELEKAKTLSKSPDQKTSVAYKAKEKKLSEEISSLEDSIKAKEDQASARIDAYTERISSIENKNPIDDTPLPSTGDLELDAEIDSSFGINQQQEPSVVEEVEQEMTKEDNLGDDVTQDELAAAIAEARNQQAQPQGRTEPDVQQEQEIEKTPEQSAIDSLIDSDSEKGNKISTTLKKLRSRRKKAKDEGNKELESYIGTKIEEIKPNKAKKSVPKDISNAASMLDSTKKQKPSKSPEMPNTKATKKTASSKLESSFDNETKSREVSSFFEKGGELSGSKPKGITSQVRNKAVNWAKKNGVKVKAVNEPNNPYYAKVKKGDDTIYINTANVNDDNTSVLNEVLPHEILHVAVNRGLAKAGKKAKDLNNELRSLTNDIVDTIQKKYGADISPSMATKLDAIKNDPSEAVNYGFTDEEFVQELMDMRYKSDSKGDGIWSKFTELIKKAAGLSGYRTKLDDIADIADNYVRLEGNTLVNKASLAAEYKSQDTNDKELDNDLDEVKDEQYASVPTMDEEKVKALYKIARNRKRSKGGFTGTIGEFVALMDAINDEIPLAKDKITSNEMIAAYNLFNKKEQLDKNKQELKEQKERDVALAMSEITGNGNAKKLTPKQKRSFRNNRAFRTGLENLVLSHFNINFIFDKMSTSLGKGYQFMNNGLVKTFGYALNSSGVQKKNGIAAKTKMIQEKKKEIFGSKIRKRMKESREAQDIELTFQYKNEDGSMKDVKETIDISEQQAATRYMQYQDETLFPTFVRYGEMYVDDAGNYQLTEAGKAISDLVKDDMKQYADFMLDSFYSDYHTEINEVYERNYGATLPKINKYSPVRRDGDVDAEDMFDVSKNGTIKNHNLTERTSNTKRIPLNKKGTEIDEVAGGYIAKMEHFKAYADIYNRMAKAFKSEDVQNAIETYHGETTLTMLNNFIDSMGSKNIIKEGSIPLIDRLRNASVVSSLAFRFPVLIKQITSFPAYASYMPEGVSYSKFALELLKSTPKLKKAWDTISQTEYGKSRFENSSFVDIQNGLSGSPGSSTLQDRLMLFTKAGDKIAIVLGGYPVYKSTYDKAIKEGKTEAEAKKMAEDKFTLATENAQQASLETNANSLQRSSGSLMRLALAYQSSPMAYFSHIARSYGVLFSNQNITAKQKVNAAKNMLLYGVVLPAMFGTVDFGFDFSEDDKDEDTLSPILGENSPIEPFNADILGHIAAGQLNGVFIFGPMLQAQMWNSVFNKNYRYTPIMFERALRDFVKVSQSASEAIEKGADKIKPEDIIQLTLDAGQVGGNFTPWLAPVSASKPIIEGVIDINNGKTPDNYGGQDITDAGFNVEVFGTEIGDWRRVVGWTRGSLMRDNKKKRPIKGGGIKLY